MHTTDATATVPDTSVWAGWELPKAAAWAEVLLAYERHRFTSTAQHMLLHALWHDWHERGSLPELRRWEQQARRLEAEGITADAFERRHEDAGVQRWSPAVDRGCPERDRT
ncbi:MAG: hypothetical protein ACQEWM_12490 [Actinomycetota bacterium]